MPSAILTPILGTVIIWAASAIAGLTLAALLATGSLSQSPLVRHPADLVILLTRGVPTSLLVVVAGLAAMPQVPPAWMPNPFPGTSDGMVLVAWAIVVALALGSTGHLAVIFRSGYRSLGTARLEQARVLGLSRWRRYRLLVRESATASLPPTGARMVHHLHNTAFAALFPVADLFGWVQGRSHETFEVTRYATIGAGVYVVLSFLIWTATRILEHRLGTRRRTPVVRTGSAPRVPIGGRA
ncbi:ABC transporter permease subunit [Virgisporangium ochraceum]|uniref:Arginine ABC transporter permease n=1 Tax=Virgisporangium ochraceum TaxID=65505 RepID=A0A8J4EDL4_9ACTN|nr:ABC transporter permease subunit [Virgisporangium ochraceum]GIJ70708.1 arginine ABC transporter permease [Virgisporangium ochraceum]